MNINVNNIIEQSVLVYFREFALGNGELWISRKGGLRVNPSYAVLAESQANPIEEDGHIVLLPTPISEMVLLKEI